MNVDKLYIVSIENTEENYSDTLGRVNDIGLPNRLEYEFMGVNGYGLTDSDLVGMGISGYDKWNVLTSDVKLADPDNRYWKRDLTRGEYGCMLSHIKIWEDAYENGYDNIIVYEDDVVSDNVFDWSVLSDIESLNYDLFYLGRLPQGGFNGVVDTPIEGYPHLCTPGYSYQTHAYMLSKSGIKKIVENHLPTLKKNLVPADEFLPAISNWTPREDLMDLFESDMNTLGLTEWNNGVVQIRTENFGNSLTQPE